MLFNIIYSRDTLANCNRHQIKSQITRGIVESFSLKLLIYFISYLGEYDVPKDTGNYFIKVVINLLRYYCLLLRASSGSITNNFTKYKLI